MSKISLSIILQTLVFLCKCSSPPSTVPQAMVYVEGASFMMGSNDCDDLEKPVHQVTLNGFYISNYEVTVGQFGKFVLATGYKTDAEKGGGAWVWTGSNWELKGDADWRNPYFEQSDNSPVVCVSLNDAVAYCSWRSGGEGLTPAYRISGSDVTCDFAGNGYRLPTEAEWEYAARGGNKSRGFQ